MSRPIRRLPGWPKSRLVSAWAAGLGLAVLGAGAVLLGNGADKPATTQEIGLGKPASAQASTEGGGPGFANDDSIQTRWISRMPFGSTWWQTDLGGTFRVSRILIQGASAGESGRYGLQGSLNETDWFPIAAGPDESTAAVPISQYDLNTAARYIRISFAGTAAGQTAELSDVRIFGTPLPESPSSPIAVAELRTDKGAYAAGSRVKFEAALTNKSGNLQTVAGMQARIYGIGTPEILLDVPLSGNPTLSPGETIRLDDAGSWTIPAVLPRGAYGIGLQLTMDDGSVWDADAASFFRIAGESDLTSYRIDKTAYQGLDVFLLDGGMSAEYAVQKAAEALVPAVSHSWSVSRRGFGPNPVYATPSFLLDSVNRTVEFFNDRFGADRKFETVILATGVASVPYVSRAMEAPVLPVHFLAGLDSVKELRDMLDDSFERGLPAFSTLGYDASVEPAVAWLKLLELPKAYIDFLNDHQVENVVIMGSYGTIGESLSQKLADGIAPDAGTEGGMQPSDIYLMYPGGGTPGDTVQLNSKIKDLGSYRLESGRRSIADWESGITPEQLRNFTASLKTRTKVRAVDFVAGQDTVNLYEFASYVMLSYYKKNESLLAAEGPVIRGVTLNPYLISHPFYEIRMGELPVLFWQFGNLNETVGVRLNRELRRAVARFFPDIRFDELKFRIGTSNNFGKTATSDRIRTLLDRAGLSVARMPDDLADEVWDPDDGMNAPVEKIADDLLSRYAPEELKEWNERLQPLTLADLEALPALYSPVTVTRQ